MSDILPPAARTRQGEAMTKASHPGKLHLQRCEECAAVQYPPRELCHACLGDRLNWKETEATGTILASALLHRSLEPWFQERSPWLMGSVKLECGPVVLVHLAADSIAAGSTVQVLQQRDGSCEAVLVAVSKTLDPDQAMALAEELL